jgi:hypothetical protein
MIAQRNPTDMHGAKRSGKENLRIPCEDGRRWVNLKKRSPIRSSRSLAPQTLNLQREKSFLGPFSRFHVGESGREEELRMEMSTMGLGWWGWRDEREYSNWDTLKQVNPRQTSQTGFAQETRTWDLKLDLRTNSRNIFKICPYASFFSEKHEASTLNPKLHFLRKW